MAVHCQNKVLYYSRVSGRLQRIHLTTSASMQSQQNDVTFKEQQTTRKKMMSHLKSHITSISESSHGSLMGALGSLMGELGSLLGALGSTNN